MRMIYLSVDSDRAKFQTLEFKSYLVVFVGFESLIFIGFESLYQNIE